jgi:hypothetical protein
MTESDPPRQEPKARQKSAGRRYLRLPEPSLLPEEAKPTSASRVVQRSFKNGWEYLVWAVKNYKDTVTGSMIVWAFRGFVLFIFLSLVKLLWQTFF